MDRFFSQLQNPPDSKSKSSTVTSQTSASTAESAVNKDDTTPKQLPKGVVLGKDGKPCRSCTSVSAWLALAKQKETETNSPSSSSPSSPLSPSPSTTATASTSTSTPLSIPSDCPPDVEALGRSTWTLLHSMSASYPSQPTQTQQTEMSQFLSLFSRLYPCWVCAEDFQTWMGREKPRLGSRAELGDWMCRAHNEVNRKLGKVEFDCRLWEERWRGGWKDGRCG
ncbi:hypothetical protein MMC10_001370 [Thelotrema lepadinum]|nr:hypothetical protein [Thelotrema lepadinum]